MSSENISTNLKETVAEETKKQIASYLGDKTALRNAARILSADNLELLTSNAKLVNNIVDKNLNLQAKKKEVSKWMNTFQDIKGHLVGLEQQYCNGDCAKHLEKEMVTQVQSATQKLGECIGNINTCKQEILETKAKLETEMDKVQKNKRIQEENLISSKIIQEAMTKIE